MPKTKKPMTLAEQFRAATSSSRKADTLRDLLDEEIQPIKGVLEEAKDRFSEVEDARNTLQEFVDFLPSLIEHGIVTEEQCEGCVDSLASIGMVITEVNPEAIGEFVDQCESLEGVLDDFFNLKEEEPYNGKRDDMESAWDEVAAAADDLADLIDAMGTL